jgi:hypothetical protein
MKKVAVAYLRASCGVRYWEDAEVNGVTDIFGNLIPCRVDDMWVPLIELNTGEILNWTKGTTANIHYEVCDDGWYELFDEEMNMVSKIEGYVPTMMCPQDDGYGDYVIMKVDGDGKIENWKVCLEAWERI